MLPGLPMRWADLWDRFNFMSYRVPRSLTLLVVAALLSVVSMASVGCTTTKAQPPRAATRIATSSKRAKSAGATATPGKVARRVESATRTSTPRVIRVDAPTEIAPPTSSVASAETAPKGSTAPRASSAKVSAQTPTRLVIPNLKMDVNVQEATWSTIQEGGKVYEDWFVPYDAVGHLDRTAKTGEAGNMVISGHHNLIAPNKFGKGLFAEMWDLQAGDVVYVFDKAGRAFAYEVFKSYKVKEAGESLSVRSQHARDIMADTGEAILTMITCWNGEANPYSGNAYRWVVAAHLVNAIDPAQVPVIAR